MGTTYNVCYAVLTEWTNRIIYFFYFAAPGTCLPTRYDVRWNIVVSNTCIPLGASLHLLHSCSCSPFDGKSFLFFGFSQLISLEKKIFNIQMCTRLQIHQASCYVWESQIEWERVKESDRGRSGWSWQHSFTYEYSVLAALRCPRSSQHQQQRHQSRLTEYFFFDFIYSVVRLYSWDVGVGCRCCTSIFLFRYSHFSTFVLPSVRLWHNRVIIIIIKKILLLSVHERCLWCCLRVCIVLYPQYTAYSTLCPCTVHTT